MKSSERLVKKFITDRTHITADDCDRLLTAHGYELHKSRGSHRTYHKKGTVPITVIIPKGKKYIISPYVNRIVRDLGLGE